MIFIAVYSRNRFHECFIFGVISSKRITRKKVRHQTSGCEMANCDACTRPILVCVCTFNLLVLFSVVDWHLFFDELEMSNDQTCTWNFQRQHILHPVRDCFFFHTLGYAWIWIFGQFNRLCHEIYQAINMLTTEMSVIYFDILFAVCTLFSFSRIDERPETSIYANKNTNPITTCALWVCEKTNAAEAHQSRLRTCR